MNTESKAERFNRLAAEVFIALKDHAPRDSHYPENFSGLDKELSAAFTGLGKPTQDQREIYTYLLDMKSQLLRQHQVISASKRIKGIKEDSGKPKPAMTATRTLPEKPKKKVTSFVLKKGADRKTESILVGHDDNSVDVIEVVRT